MELLTFKEWLLRMYGETPEHLYTLCIATGNYGDYNKVMEWYRRRYRYDNVLREQLLAANPFSTERSAGSDTGPTTRISEGRAAKGKPEL